MFYNDSTNSYDFIRTKEWHHWFAWKPTKIGDKTVWFKKIFRRGYRYDLRTHLIGGGPALSGWNWEYAENLYEMIAKADDQFPPTYTTVWPRPPPPPAPKNGVAPAPKTPPPPPPRILKF
jgi:hypothetical protein